ncbi:hypothetical protein BD779DRAFT_1572538, partial [Infundibulicybe gibba]
GNMPSLDIFSNAYVSGNGLTEQVRAVKGWNFIHAAKRFTDAEKYITRMLIDLYP